MDDTKKPLGAVTMVYEDYFFLERWYDHYRRQVGAENLYVFSHGNDPRHREIADGANVMNVPRDPSMQKFDRRRWRMMGLFASGMLEFYRWMVVSDVDEILVLDPRAGDSIPGYLAANYGDPRKSPRNLSPLGLELFHLPGEEPLPIAPDETILSRRRIFRPSRNYSKPCLIGAPAIFGPGGHRNNLGPRHMPEDPVPDPPQVLRPCHPGCPCRGKGPDHHPGAGAEPRDQGKPLFQQDAGRLPRLPRNGDADRRGAGAARVPRGDDEADREIRQPVRLGARHHHEPLPPARTLRLRFLGAPESGLPVAH